VIEIKNLTMTYPNGKGIFDVEFEVRKGEVVGFLGPNGAGKTTAIRCLLGFMKGQSGECTIDGRECFANASELCKKIGFIAGEPAFPDGMTGVEYLNYLCEVRGIKDKSKMTELIAYFEFDPKGKIKRMSKGMKQKTAIVAAFLHDPDIYILDEPTSGLDPIMQSKFVDLILREKKRGKTILMSSHMFDEIERASDFVVIIKNGRIVAKDRVKALKQMQKKVFIVESPDFKKMKVGFDCNAVSDTQGEFLVPASEVDKFVKEISKYKVDGLMSKEVSLESIFMNYYAAAAPDISSLGSVSSGTRPSREATTSSDRSSLLPSTRLETSGAAAAKSRKGGGK